MSTRPGSGRSSRPGSARSTTSSRGRDEDFVYDCKAAYLCILDDVTDNITSRTQLRNALQQTGRNPSKKCLSTYWRDSTELLTFDEFCDICRKEHVTSEDDLMKAFRQIDINGDGYISHSELYKVLTTKGEKMTKQEVKDMIDEVDVNKDGKLDYKEFCQFLLSTSNDCKKLSKDKLDKKASQRNGRPSSGRDRDKSSEPSPRSRNNDPPKPVPRVTRQEEKVFPALATKKVRLPEPKKLSDWKHLHSKGCSFIEDDGEIISHQYTLALKQDTSVWITIESIILHPEESANTTSIDTALFILREKADTDGNRLITFTEIRDHKGKYCVRCDLDKGRYTLIPMTTGCRLKTRKTQPEVESKLIKKEKDDYDLTKCFKDTLSDIFEIADLDGNSLMSREEFNWYNMRTAGESVGDEEWEVVEENVELKNGELTRKGFIELNQMEVEDSEGDTSDLWVTLTSMGYNKGLLMDQAAPFKLEVYTEDDSSASLKIKTLAAGGSHLEKAICESVIGKGDSTRIRGLKDLTMHTYTHGFRTTVVFENKANSSINIFMDYGQSKNCVNNHNHMSHKVHVPSRSTVIGCHLMAENEYKQWVLRSTEAMVDTK